MYVTESLHQKYASTLICLPQSFPNLTVENTGSKNPPYILNGCRNERLKFKKTDRIRIAKKKKTLKQIKGSRAK